jgi:hypothetical protein
MQTTTQSQGRAPIAPIHWWEVLTVADPQKLPFISLYLDALSGGFTGRCAVPTAQEDLWGEDSEFIESWFNAGEELQFVDTFVHDLHIEEPNQWERVMDWVRSVLVAARNCPAPWRP